jgi:zinc transport system ATP-binding protein
MAEGLEIVSFMVKAENLLFSYTGSPPYVLNGINMEIRSGEYVSLVGENGSGKTTLIRLILKFIKPLNGNIFSRSKKLGYVPQKQDSSNSSFPITVYEALDSYRRLLKIKDKSVIVKNLKQVGMSQFKNALIGTLSAGQSQKILLARALMGNPDLLLLDEPSTGIDMNSQKEIYHFLKKINEENGITVISVEHNLEAAIANSTLIYHMVSGQGHLCTPQQYAGELLKTMGRGEIDA